MNHLTVSWEMEYIYTFNKSWKKKLNLWIYFYCLRCPNSSNRRRPTAMTWSSLRVSSPGCFCLAVNNVRGLLATFPSWGIGLYTPPTLESVYNHTWAWCTRPSLYCRWSGWYFCQSTRPHPLLSLRKTEKWLCLTHCIWWRNSSQRSCHTKNKDRKCINPWLLHWGQKMVRVIWVWYIQWARFHNWAGSLY